MKITKTVMKISYADMVGIMNSIGASEGVFIECDYGEDMPLQSLFDQLSLNDFMPFLVHVVGASGIKDCLLAYCRLFRPEEEQNSSWMRLIFANSKRVHHQDYSARICQLVTDVAIQFILEGRLLTAAIPILQEMCKLEAYTNRPIKAFTQEFINTYNQ